MDFGTATTGLPLIADRLSTLGAWGPAAFALVFAIAGMVFVPAGLLTLAAGALFGLRDGLLSAYAGAMLGACASFLVSRYVARDLVERRVTRHARMAAISAAVSEHGGKIVFLLRLSPVVPFSAINYSMGVTRIPFRDYALASLGMLPVTALYVYYGAVAGSIVAATRGQATEGRAHYVMLGVGLLATIIATTIVTRVASRSLEAQSASR